MRDKVSEEQLCHLQRPRTTWSVMQSISILTPNLDGVIAIVCTVRQSLASDQLFGLGKFRIYFNLENPSLCKENCSCHSGGRAVQKPTADSREPPIYGIFEYCVAVRFFLCSCCDDL